MRRYLIFIIAALFAGCKVGPDYHRPKVEAPASFQYEEPNAINAADTEWWKGFGDPVLDRLVAEALANNKNVKIAAANIEQAAGLLTQTRSGLFPQATYSGSAARERISTSSGIPGSGFGFANPRNSYEVLAGASWEIDFWGRIRRLTEAARANLLASEEARRSVILSLVSSVASSYIQLRGLDEQLIISRKTLADYNESLRLFELQFQHGQVNQMTVEQARSQYETALAAIPQFESQIVQTENAINILLARNPGEIQRGRILAELGAPVIPAGVPSQLLERRPDILQAEQNLIAANAQIGAARALYFPTISLTGAYGNLSSDLSDLFKGPSREWNYGGVVTGPIFTAGGISGQVKQAEAAQKAALENYQNIIIGAFNDVENALISRSKLSEQLNAQTNLVQALREYARLARMQYDEGYTPYLTVLDAQSQLFTAELNFAQIQTAALNSYIRIYQAMGGGWIDIAGQLTKKP